MNLIARLVTCRTAIAKLDRGQKMSQIQIILCDFRSEKFHKQQAKEQAQREANSPMKNCVLKFDHFENIHRYNLSINVIIEHLITIVHFF